MKRILNLIPVIALTSLAYGQVLNQPPQQGFSLFSVEGTGSNADNFVVQGSSAEINTVRIWGSWDPDGMPQADQFVVRFLSNVVAVPDDEPGPAIHSFLNLSPVVTATGLSMTVSGLPRPEYELVITLPMTVTLAPGTYWVEVFSQGSPGGGHRFVWQFADLDIVNGVPCLAWDGQAPGVGWNVCTNFFFQDDLAVVLSLESTDVLFCDPAENNSTGGPASLSGTLGSGVGSGLHLECTGGVPSQFGYFLIGTGANDPGIAISDGRLCLETMGGNQIGRYNVISPGALNSTGVFNGAGVLLNAVGTATSSGGSGYDVPSSIPTIGGLISAGQTWYFQVWYRENGGTANFSNVLGITF